MSATQTSTMNSSSVSGSKFRRCTSASTAGRSTIHPSARSKAGGASPGRRQIQSGATITQKAMAAPYTGRSAIVPAAPVASLNSQTAPRNATTVATVYPVRARVRQRAKAAHSQAASARMHPTSAVQPSAGNQNSAARHAAAKTMAVTMRSRSIAEGLAELRQPAAGVGEIDNCGVFGGRDCRELLAGATKAALASPIRSEEHTSELQSLRHLVCRLLLEKKKKNS